MAQLAQLAIKGHESRGNEVIKLLEMLGGKDTYNLKGDGTFDGTFAYYTIDRDGVIRGGIYISNDENENIVYFTLEEFEDKFPYKIGDKVKNIYGKISIVKQLVWSDEDNAVRYELEDDEDSLYFANELQLYNKEDKVGTIMAKLAIQGHKTRGNEVIELLEMLGGKNTKYYTGTNIDSFYFINDDNTIDLYYTIPTNYTIFTLEEFIEKFPYKVGDKVKNIYGKIGIIKIGIIKQLVYSNKDNAVRYELEDDEDRLYFANELQLCNKEEDKGNISDGYHTFNELYEYRLLYQASLFNEFAKQGLYDVHKSKRHSDGNIPFDDENWFIVMAELPTGQISNHYEMKDWDLFDIPIKDKSNPYDGHTPQDVVKRLREFLIPKSKYPTTYKECCEVLEIGTLSNDVNGWKEELLVEFQELLIARDAYWKIAGREMGLDKPWEPDWKDNQTDKYFICYLRDEVWMSNIRNCNKVLVFPTEEIRDTFYTNFKHSIERCKELL